jgi:hypothetical protein
MPFGDTHPLPAAIQGPPWTLFALPLGSPDGGSIENPQKVLMRVVVKTGSKVRRTEIIRALVAALQGSGLDLTAAGTEAAIRDVQKCLKG